MTEDTAPQLAFLASFAAKLFDPGANDDRSLRWNSSAAMRFLSERDRSRVFRALAGADVTLPTTRGREVTDKKSSSSSSSTAAAENDWLVRLNILVTKEGGDGEGKPTTKSKTMKLSEGFARGLQMNVMTATAAKDGATTGEEAIPYRTPNRSSSIILQPFQIELYEGEARECWSDIHRFLLQSGGGEASTTANTASTRTKRLRMSGSDEAKDRRRGGLDERVVTVVRKMRLVSERQDDSITNLGYEFLLTDVYTQVWALVQRLIPELLEEEKLRALRSLFKLWFSRHASGWLLPDDDLRPFLVLFRELGLIYVRTRPNTSDGGEVRGGEEEEWFRPSRLGIYALSPPPLSTRLDPKNKTFEGLQVIVETTFSVFAYTMGEEMHVWLLRLFAEVEKRLPNLVVGRLTRESVGAALDKGISAAQVVSFLVQNAHPQCRMRRGPHVVPENVRDQILMWERERNRIKVTEGANFQLGHHSEDDFAILSRWAEAKEASAWRDPARKWIFVKKSFIEEFRLEIEKLNAEDARDASSLSAAMRDDGRDLSRLF